MGAIYTDYDEYSVREFLQLKGWSESLIEMFGLLNDHEAFMNSSFLELFREEAGNHYADMCQIIGGMDRFADTFLPQLEKHIRYEARVIALNQMPDRVTVHCLDSRSKSIGVACGDCSASGALKIVNLPPDFSCRFE